MTKSEEEDLQIEGEEYSLKLDGISFPANTAHVSISVGKHNLSLKVSCHDRIPSLYIKGNTQFSYSSWQLISEDKEWIGESGEISHKSGTILLNAGSRNFNPTDLHPSKYRLSVIPLLSKRTEKSGNGILIDFGKETIDFVKFHN